MKKTELELTIPLAITVIDKNGNIIFANHGETQMRTYNAPDWKITTDERRFGCCAYSF
jgi:hypothetical protein